MIQLGLSLAGTRAERLLLAHCLYWWNSFGKGYLYEVTIFRDLRATGIRFVGHDLRHREERLSPSDLVVLGHHGDIKTSTYFLHVTRTFPLRHDFYITRLFEVGKRKWHDAVILKPSFWMEINGEPQLGSIEETLRFFPQAVLVEVHNVQLIVVSYEYWKQKVKIRQQQEGRKTKDGPKT